MLGNRVWASFTFTAPVLLPLDHSTPPTSKEVGIRNVTQSCSASTVPSYVVANTAPCCRALLPPPDQMQNDLSSVDRCAKLAAAAPICASRKVSRKVSRARDDRK